MKAAFLSTPQISFKNTTTMPKQRNKEINSTASSVQQSMRNLAVAYRPLQAPFPGALCPRSKTVSHSVFQRPQESSHRVLVVVYGQINRPTVRVVPGLRVSPVLHQHAHSVQKARPGRVVEGGAPGVRVRDVGIRSVPQ